MPRPKSILRLAHLPHRDISVGFDPIMAVNIDSWTAFKAGVVTKIDAKRGLTETANNAEGNASDGYIAFAQGEASNASTKIVFERFQTDNAGAFRLTTSNDDLPDFVHILIVAGTGTDISTNTTYTSDLTAVASKQELIDGTSEIFCNPVTTMVASIANEESTFNALAITNAKTDVKQALGLTDEQLNKDYIKETDTTMATITAQLETLALTLKNSMETLTTVSKTEVNLSIAKVIKERSETTVFDLANVTNIDVVTEKVRVDKSIPVTTAYTNLKTNSKALLTTVLTNINNVTGDFTQKITEAKKIKVAAETHVSSTAVKSLMQTDDFVAADAVNTINTAKASVNIQTIEAPTKSTILPPGAPTIKTVAAKESGYGAAVSWEAPSSNGGANITGYKLEYIPLTAVAAKAPQSITGTSVLVNVASLAWTASSDDGNLPVLEYSINRRADAVSVYCFYHGYMGGEYLISGSSDDYSDATALTSETVVNVISTSSGNRYTFNGETTYHENKSYKITGTGYYTFKDVPSSHPIAILNNGITNITYTGLPAKKSTKAVTGTTNDGTYDFYHGDVTVTVSGTDFSYYAPNTAITTKSDALTGSVTGLPMAVKYFFKISAVTDYGVGDGIETSISYLAATYPGEPTNLKANIVKSSNTSVLLTWSEPSDGGEPIDYYEAQYSLDNTTWLPATPYQMTSSTFEKLISGLLSGKEYKFRARAVNGHNLNLPGTGPGQYSEISGIPGRFADEPLFPTTSSKAIVTSYIHSGYFYKAYTFNFSLAAAYTLVAGASTLHNNGTVTASGRSNSNYDWTNAFDNNQQNSNNGWGVETTTGWIKFEFDESRVIGKYRIWAAKMFSWGRRWITDWTLQASNDNSSWDILDTQTGIQNWNVPTSNPSDMNSDDYKEFIIDNKASYQYYKINVTQSYQEHPVGATPTANSVIMIGEIAYYSAIYTSEYQAFTVSSTQKFDIFMIGGGGGGGDTWGGGGGGSGSAVWAKDWTIAPNTYNILVGDGGAGGTGSGSGANDGFATTFGSLFATKGGGKGGGGGFSGAGGLTGLRGTVIGGQGTATSVGGSGDAGWGRGATHVFNGLLTDGSDGEHTAPNVFENNVLKSGKVFHIMFVFPTNTKIINYKIWGRTSSNYNPKSWELRGCNNSAAYDTNDTDTYSVLDTQTDVADIGASNTNSITNDTNRGEYNVSTPGSYTTYVLNITKSHDDNHCFIGEIAYYKSQADSSLIKGNDGGSGGGSSNYSATDGLLAAGAGGLNGSGDTHGTVSSFGSNSAGDPLNAFDNSNSNWSAGHITGSGGNTGTAPNIVWVSFTFPNNITVNKYRIWPRYHHNSNYKRQPKDWELRGVTSGTTYDDSDSSTYDVVDTVTGQSSWPTQNPAFVDAATHYREFTVDSPGIYNQYILRVTKSNATYFDQIMITEIAYFSPPNSEGGASKFESASATIDLDSGNATKYYNNQSSVYNLSSTENVTIYGNDGGSSVLSSGSTQDFGAGGGGIGAAGSNATTNLPGAGGTGLQIDYRYGPTSGTTSLKENGSAITHPGIQYYGGGGGGGSNTSTGATGGNGVGGAGVKNGTVAVNAAANTGSGGGGGSNGTSAAGSGSSGVVMIRQLIGAVGVPFAPTNVSAVLGNQKARVFWNAPNWDGTNPISNYKIEYAESPYTTWSAKPLTNSSPYTVENLTNGTAYKFRVSAVNSEGTGPASALTSAITPTTFSVSGGTETTYTSNSVTYKVHTFTSVGTSTLYVTGTKNVDFLIVAGGGPGGFKLGGGGGGGGVIAGNFPLDTDTDLTITVGQGGAGPTDNTTHAVDGDHSSVTGTQFNFKAYGGGGAGGYDTPSRVGNDGGSGGGHGDGSSRASSSAKYWEWNSSAFVAGNMPSNGQKTIATNVVAYGNKGGASGGWRPTGGGGAGEEGTETDPTLKAGHGGDGIQVSWLTPQALGHSGAHNGVANAEAYYWGGGGGGNGHQTSVGSGNGGRGGGGAGSKRYNQSHTQGVAQSGGYADPSLSDVSGDGTGGNGGPNTGGGGGGGDYYTWSTGHGNGSNGGSGGSGIVVIRYQV